MTLTEIIFFGSAAFLLGFVFLYGAMKLAGV